MQSLKVRIMQKASLVRLELQAHVRQSQSAQVSRSKAHKYHYSGREHLWEKHEYKSYSSRPVYGTQILSLSTNCDKVVHDTDTDE